MNSRNVAFFTQIDIDETERVFVVHGLAYTPEPRGFRPIGFKGGLDILLSEIATIREALANETMKHIYGEKVPYDAVVEWLPMGLMDDEIFSYLTHVKEVIAARPRKGLN